jgi:RHS repeat-associated protein
MGSYDAFGNIVAVTGSTAESDRFIFGFAGGLWDPATKLVQFGARTYDPEIGRWLERDPSLHKGGGEYLFESDSPSGNNEGRLESANSQMSHQSSHEALFSPRTP